MEWDEEEERVFLVTGKTQKHNFSAKLVADKLELVALESSPPEEFFQGNCPAAPAARGVCCPKKGEGEGDRHPTHPPTGGGWEQLAKSQSDLAGTFCQPGKPRFSSGGDGCR